MAALLELGAGFHPELTGRENVYLNASFLGLTRRDTDRVYDDIVGLRRARGVHGQPGEVLLLGHAGATGVRGGGARRPRDPADRRGAGRRRRGLPAAVHQPGATVPGRRTHDRAGDTCAGHRHRRLRPRRHAGPRQGAHGRGSGRRGARAASSPALGRPVVRGARRAPKRSRSWPSASTPAETATAPCGRAPS